VNTQQFSDGLTICGDCLDPEVMKIALSYEYSFPLIIADPPYGNIVSDVWDRVSRTDKQFAEWMMTWTRSWSTHVVHGGAMYVWGGIGKVGFRPFMKYLTMVEVPDYFELANLITWSKKRAYGVQNNYLFTREECAYFVHGDAKKPRLFNIPLLDDKRGYAGYNVKYPAKSEYLRRTNVWTDITEIFKGKAHTAQKQQRLHEIMIEVHTNPGEVVVDLFAGSGTTAHAARKLGRRFIVIEKDRKIYEKMVERLVDGS
jgi:site-specific DNA-methyltransferase (adenine-specific)